MSKYDFDEIIDRRGTNSLKYEAAREYNPLLPEGNLPMWVADMDFACPQPILDAMRARLDRRILGYSAPIDPAYFSAVQGWMKRRHGFDVERWQLATSEGVVRAMEEAVRRLTPEGGGVIVTTPGYTPFDRSVRMYGRTPVHSALVLRDGGFGFDWDDLERKAADPNTKLFFLCNPHNPTGRVWTEAELRRVAEMMFANGVFIFCDEIWNDHLRTGVKHVSLASLYPGRSGYLIATAPSKTFNVAGNGLANLFLPERGMAEEWQSALGSPNPLSLVACQAAYDECEDWVDEMRAYLDGNFALLRDELARQLPKARFAVPEGTYLAWVDLRAYGKNDRELNEAVSKQGLFAEFGDSFIADGEGWMRLNVACPRALVAKAVGLLAQALEG